MQKSFSFLSARLAKQKESPSKNSTVHELTTIQQSILVLVATPWSAVGAAFMINSITTTRNIKDSKNDSVHLQLLVGHLGSISTVEK